MENEKQLSSAATIRRAIANRGERPILRGRLHANAAWYFGGTGTTLICATGAITGISFLTLATIIYVVLLIGMLTVSALYHRFPWRTEAAVAAWRRADHAMIALFIAGTYGPVILAADRTAMAGWLLLACWLLAIGAVILNLVWITHPRWLGVAVYFALGWIAVFDFGALASGLSTAVLVLILVGGGVYTAGAISYALQRPNISDRWFGFHELFHAATIVAAGLHHIAIWLIILNL